LDLPPIFWKKIIGQEISEWDLKTIDTYTWQMIVGLRKYLPKDDVITGQEGGPEGGHKDPFKVDGEEKNELTYTEEEFYATVDQKFVVLLSNGIEIELC
jgi:hypothetical protein